MLTDKRVNTMSNWNNGNNNNFGSTGWGDVDNWEQSESKASDFASKPRSFWVPAEATKRVMFLDGSPFCFFEHNLWALTKSMEDKEICLKKSGIESSCPLCDYESPNGQKLWPSFVGYFSVVDMGDVTYGAGGEVTLEGWTSQKGVTYQFGTKLLGAKRGGKEKPGMLKKLQRLAQKYGGDLTGTVWDVYRSGKKTESIGDEWEFVEKVDPSEWETYMLNLGADHNQLSLKPLNYGEIFTPSSIEDLNRLVGNNGAPSDEDDPWGGSKSPF